MERRKVIIVDETDTPIGLKERADIDPTKDTYRCTGVWITNSQDEVLIARRKLTKDVDPGKWGPAVAGTVEEGETYESNAMKEAEEELGLKNVKLDLGPKNHLESPRKYFGQWFVCKVDKAIEDFVIQEDEVEQIAWVGKKELKKDLEANPDKYVPALSRVVDLLI